MTRAGRTLVLVSVLVVAAVVAAGAACDGGASALAPKPGAAAPTGAERAALEAEFEELASGYDRSTGAEVITVTGLQQALAAAAAGNGAPSVVLLDTREAVEFNAGHLPGARLLPPARVSDNDALPEIPDGALVVACCTVGYRSGIAAKQLATRLNRPVKSLHGGIIAWFNAGGAVKLPDGSAATSIHAYSAAWGRFVFPRQPADAD